MSIRTGQCVGGSVDNGVTIRSPWLRRRNRPSPMRGGGGGRDGSVGDDHFSRRVGGDAGGGVDSRGGLLPRQRQRRM